MNLRFLKMQGIGNDFVVVSDKNGDEPGKSLALTPDLAKKICDRRFGIGADQILWLRAPQNDLLADCRMEILNADGSTAEMCGNGIRAVGLYLYRYGAKPKQSRYLIDTLAGTKTVEVSNGNQVTVDMGAPGTPEAGKFPPEMAQELEISGEKLRFHGSEHGNPHAVFFVEDLSQTPVAKWGSLIEMHPRFPKRTNVEFVQILNSHEIRVGVWERGAGITLACGTGACASAVASLATGKVKGTILVHLPGGTLKVSWAGGSEPVLMEGPAEEVFRGEIEI